MTSSHKAYRINEIFYSLQGEGGQVGLTAVFVRFAGCNLACKEGRDGFDCDTDFSTKFCLDSEQILEAVYDVRECCEHVIFTGGEPMLQLDYDLVMAFINEGFVLSLETNGTIEIPHTIRKHLNWIAVSPKRHSKLLVEDPNELRYVLPPHHAPFPLPKDTEAALYVSPVWTNVMGKDVLDKESLAWCIEWVKHHPEYRLSTQSHKLWGIR